MSSSPEARVLRGGSTAAQFPDIDRVEDLLYSMDGMPLTFEQKQAKEAGFRKGWDAGWERAFGKGYDAGRQEAYEQFTELLSATLKAADEAVRQLRAVERLTLEQIEGSVVTMAAEIVDALVGRHLEVTAAPVLDAMRRAIDLAPDRGAIRLRLNPDDVAIVQAAIGHPARETTLVPDLAVERGGCVAEVGACRIDAQMAPALERVRAALRAATGSHR